MRTVVIAVVAMAGRLSLTARGLVRYTLKTPYRDGTTHVIFEPLDFIARLAALVPKPRVHLTRYHGSATGCCISRRPLPEIAGAPPGRYTDRDRGFEIPMRRN